MNTTNTAIRSLLLLLLVGVAAVLINTAFPAKTFAAELSVQTAQILPLGGSTCAPLSASGFVSYIYDGALHSFEFFVHDSSYVAVLGSAGNTSIPFNQMTRRAGPSGGVQIHADIATTPIPGSLPVRITLLSAKGPGQPVCLAMINTSVTSAGGIVTITQPQPAPTPAPTPTPSPVTTPTKPVSVTGNAPVGSAATTSTAGRGTTTSVVVTSSPFIANIQNALRNACVAEGGAARIWFFLLAIYLLIVCAALFWRPRQVPFTYREEWIAGAIVIPFVLLFGFWYLVESCRISPLVPAIAILIALGGLATAFWNDRERLKVIPLPAAKK